MEFIRKRLQVFVSSTFSDLITDRQAAVEAILTAGHIPAGMELFTAGDESQMDIIKQWIDESDLYLVIVGGRYGSVEPNTGKSYTQLEYEYAVEKKKPLFACVIKEAALEVRVKEQGSSVIETDNPQKMKDFRALVLTRMVRFWEDEKDIKISVGETLAQFSRREDLTGWVRPSEQANLPALADEVTRLSKENAELRNRLAASGQRVDLMGLDFQGIQTLLESKGLLQLLTLPDTRTALSQEFHSLPGVYDSQLLELSIIGLIIPTRKNIGIQYYVLSDEGRKFLNISDLNDHITTQQTDESKLR